MFSSSPDVPVNVVYYAGTYYRAYSAMEPGSFWRELRPIRCVHCEQDCTANPPQVGVEWYCSRQCLITEIFEILQEGGVL